jgi:UDP-glucose 4-epimerase
MNMRICVLGGSGFLGSHVADKLSSRGHNVLIYDRQSSPWLQKNQEICLGDILEEDKLLDAISGCDVVYNFAGLSDLNDTYNKPVETAKINVLGNINVLEACRYHQVKRYIYASTMYVYSREGGFYRCSKQAAEHYVEEYQNIFGLEYTILRYGSLYGPRANRTNGLFRIVQEAMETGKLRYEGNIEALRQYIHVEDAASASVDVLGEQFSNQSVILTGQESIRLYDLLQMLGEILGIENTIQFLEKEQLGHYVRTPYAYQPKLGRKYFPPMHVDLGQGLLQLIEYIRQNSSSQII